MLLSLIIHAFGQLSVVISFLQDVAVAESGWMVAKTQGNNVRGYIFHIFMDPPYKMTEYNSLVLRLSEYNNQRLKIKAGCHIKSPPI